MKIWISDGHGLHRYLETVVAGLHYCQLEKDTTMTMLSRLVGVAASRRMMVGRHYCDVWRHPKTFCQKACRYLTAGVSCWRSCRWLAVVTLRENEELCSLVNGRFCRTTSGCFIMYYARYCDHTRAGPCDQPIGLTGIPPPFTIIINTGHY